MRLAGKVRLATAGVVAVGFVPFAATSGAAPVGVPTMTLTSLSALEGDDGTTTVQLQLFLSRPLPLPTVVAVTALPGATATAEDYALGANTVTIPAGATTAAVPVEVFGDRNPEPDKSVTLLATAAGGVAGPATGVLTVVDDDRSQRVDVSPTGQQADGPASLPIQSLDGLHVAFGSEATNLTADPQGPGDYNGTWDAFVRNVVTGATVKGTVTPSGADPSDGATVEGVSADGRYVSFYSAATDLLPGRTAPYGRYSVYRRDLWTGTTELVSAMPDGSFPDGSTDGGTMTPDGRYIAFVTTANLTVQQPDGTWLDDNSGSADVYVRDMVTGVTRLASTNPVSGFSNGGCATAVPALSADGSKAVFTCTVYGTPRLLMHDFSTGQTSELPLAPYGDTTAVVADEVAVDADAAHVVVMTEPLGTYGGVFDVYCIDVRTGKLQLVSHRPDGSRSVGRTNWPEISADGRVVTFSSTATDLVAGGPASGRENVYAEDLATGQVFWVSQGNLGAEPDGASGTMAAGNGVNAVFTSWADNIVSGDTNGVADVFLRRLAVLPDLRVAALSIAADPLAPRVAMVPVTLSAPETHPVQVDWTVSAGTAQAGRDFVAGSGSVTIPAGSQLAYVPVTVVPGAHAGTVVVAVDSAGGPAASVPSSSLTITG